MRNFLSALSLIILFSVFTRTAEARQAIGSWDAVTSLLSFNDMVIDNDDRIWAITNGGLLSWKPGESLETYTQIDGLYRLRPTAIGFQQDENKLWLGYSDGRVQLFDIQRSTFQDVTDIWRNQNFTNKRINRIKFNGGKAYVATEFGVVVFDTDRVLVLDSYVNLGRFPRGTTALDIVFNGSWVYVATSAGIARGNEESGSLAVPDNWDNSDGLGDFGNLQLTPIAIAWFDDRLYAGTSGENVEFNNGQWQATTAFIGRVSRFSMSRSGSALTSVSTFGVTIRFGNEEVSIINLSGSNVPISSLLNDSNSQFHLYVGTGSNGVFYYNSISAQPDQLRPAGPESNFFTDFTSQNGSIIAGTTDASVSGFSGYHIFRDGAWQSFGLNNTPELNAAGFNRAFRTAADSDHFYFGSWGRGVVKHNRITDDIQVFNHTNSSLELVAGLSSFVVITGMDSDAQDNIWAVSWQAANNPLARYNSETNEWISFPYASATGLGNFYYNLFIDSFNQKWITLQSTTTTGRGLLVLRTNSDGSQDAVRLTSTPNEGNLPGDRVQTVVQDKRGEIWIGTNRGVARFIFPDRVIDGNVADRQASFLINADTSATSPFLLRDVNATVLAVNAANQKWVGTAGDGLWLIDENGRNVLRHFTPDNSPLFSNSITGLHIDEITGLVYIATSEGLQTYMDVATEGQRRIDDLFVYPNPYSYDRNSGNVIIDGLTDDSLISIITVDGRLVSRFETRGGRAEWNVRDYSGNRVASGVYIIVATENNGSERGVGKISVIR